MGTMDEFGYAQCSTCHGEFLKETLDSKGRCELCAAKEKTT